MRTRTAEWFEVKIRYEKTMENGAQKKVSEIFTVDAVSFTEAEKRATEEMVIITGTEFFIQDIKRASYGEVFFSDDADTDRWYKAKVQYIAIDEKNGKEKRSNTYYLVNAKTIEGARKMVDEVLGKTMIDYEIASLVETQIQEVWEYGCNSSRGVEEEKE